MNIIAIIPEQLPSINWQTWISIIISILAFGISGFTLWYEMLRHAKIKGVLSKIIFQKNNHISSKDVIELSNIIEPSFILKNVGAQSAIIENIKLEINCDGEPCIAYLYQYKVLENTEKDFIAIMLANNEIWENKYKFKLEEQYKKFIPNTVMNISIKLKFLGKKTWVSVTINNANFNFSQKELNKDHVKNDLNSSYNHKIVKNFMSHLKE